MRKALCILTLIAVFLGLSGVGIASLGDYCNNSTGKEYLSIFVEYLLASKPSKESDYFLAVKSLTIDKYEEFIRKHPDSSFVPEAKLRIAEFYDVICQRKKAKIWLDDIIANHREDDHVSIKVYYSLEGEYSRFELIPSGEKTAAWALYYRAIWFPKNKTEDLKRIVNEYKDSKKVAGFAKELLKK